MAEAFKVDPAWTDKDSKVEEFRQLYETREFMDAYAAHTDIRLKADPKSAIGRSDEWESHGAMQLKFLRRRGMKPSSRLLDIGCGPGRAARHLVPYLDSCNYIGVDISAACLEHANALARGEGWEDKWPTFIRNGDLDIDAPPAFDFMWAHSVFTHLPAAQIEVMVSNAAPRLKSDGQLLFTYKHSDQPERVGLKQFKYPFAVFEEIAIRHGLLATLLDVRWPAKQRTGLMAKPL
jgi:SAM-dependent methyltransferase